MEISEEILRQAFVQYNKEFIEELGSINEQHHFSNRFKRKMSRLIRAQKSFGGRMWLVNITDLAAKAAVIVISFIVINTLSVKAFNFNIWNTIVNYANDFIEITFEKDSDSKVEDIIPNPSRLKINTQDTEYVLEEYYVDEYSTLQVLSIDESSITYMEGEITEFANIELLKGEVIEDRIGGRDVRFIDGEESFMAFFTDNEYYHLLTIQGNAATKEMAIEIIGKLEEQ